MDKVFISKSLFEKLKVCIKIAILEITDFVRDACAEATPDSINNKEHIIGTLHVHLTTGALMYSKFYCNRG